MTTTITSPLGASERATDALAASRHRDHLDGIRAFAMLMAVAFHAGVDRMSGGFLGVDMFYVLSGYLVTGILLDDQRKAGGVRWLRFYTRRIRRLLPASFVVLAVSAIVFGEIAAPSEVTQVSDAFRSAFVYVANWHFVGQSTDYFAADVETNPVLHFWSLAVEEQFYLLWPAVFVALTWVSRRAGRHRRALLGAMVAALALASAASAFSLVGTRPERAYFGTDVRVFQLLLGAMLVVVPAGFTTLARSAHLRATVAWVSFLGIAALSTSALAMGAVERGYAAAGLTASLIVAMDSGPGTVARLLGLRPAAYIGRITYGIYLWHWPIVVYARMHGVTSSRALFVWSALGATALAAVSSWLLELPIRKSPILDRRPRAVLAAWVAASLVGWFVVVPLALRTPSSQGRLIPVTDPASAAASEGELRDWFVASHDIARDPDCWDEPVAKCTVRTGAGPHVLLMGDSTAKMWIASFDRLSQDLDLTYSVAVMAGCPWQRELDYGGSAQVITDCNRRREDWYERVVPTLDPDVIVLAQRGHDDPNQPSRIWINGGPILTRASPFFLPVLRGVTERSLDQLDEPGRRIAVLESVPIPPPSMVPLQCLSRTLRADQCSWKTRVQRTAAERYLDELEASGRVVTLDLDRAVCPRYPTCDAFVGDIITYRDTVHLTPTYARSLWREVVAALAEAGVDLEPTGHRDRGGVGFRIGSAGTRAPVP